MSSGQLHPERLRANAKTELRKARRAWWELREKDVITPARWAEVTASVGEIEDSDTWSKVDAYQRAIQEVDMAREREIKLAFIQPSRWQPRGAVFDEEALWELAKSIQEIGLINAVMVFALPPAEVHATGSTTALYELVAGERRTRALIGLALGQILDNHTPKEYVSRLANVGLAGLSEQEHRALLESGATIRARVESLTDKERLHRVAVMENLERQSLTPLEEARGLQSLVDAYGYSQRELARRIGRSQSWVAQRVRLLDLDGAAQEAVSTRVLTTTHARAISVVPEPLQEAVTEWAIEAVSRNDAPATTRQVGNRARQVAAFVDPERWQPNGETVYTPAERNRLAAIRWALDLADLEAQSAALLGLSDVGYAGHNLLGRSPKKIAGDEYDFKHVMEALGVDEEKDVILTIIGRTCETCVMESMLGSSPDVDDFPFGYHCPRYRNATIEACWEYIGSDDPVVIPIESYSVRRALEKVDAPLITRGSRPRRYFDSVSAYVKAYGAAVQAHEEEQARLAEEERTQHIEPLRRYGDWQSHLPLKTHFQAHACHKCLHHEPINLQEGLPPCRFVRDPLESKGYQRDGHPRAPEFGALIGKALAGPVVLPRCEQFAYADVPPLHYGVSINVPLSDRERVLEWLMAIGKVGQTRSNVIWGALRWLPYGAPRNQAQDWGRLTRWIRDHWDEVLGDVGVAALFDVMISEAKARQSYSGPITLYNPETGKDETWYPVAFSAVDPQREHRRKPYSYPDDWPDLWSEEDES